MIGRSRTFPDPQGTSIWGPRSWRRAWWWSPAVPWRSHSSSSSSTSPWRRLSFGSQFSSTSLLSDAPEISDSSRLTSRIFRMLSSAICLCLRCLSTLKSKFYFFLFATTKYQTSVDWRCQNYLRVPNVNRLTFTKFTIYRPLIKIENKSWHKCNLKTLFYEY